VISTLVSRIARVVFGPPVYLIDPRSASGFAFHGPKRIADLIRKFGDGQYDTAPHESGVCDILAKCDDCARSVQRARTALHA
jgi:hypothetical protein